MGNTISCSCREDDRDFVGRTAELQQRERAHNTARKAAKLPLGFHTGEYETNSTQPSRTESDLCYTPSDTELRKLNAESFDGCSSSECSSWLVHQLPLGFKQVEQPTIREQEAVLLGPESVLGDSWDTDMTWSTGLTDALPLGLKIPNDGTHVASEVLAVSLRTMMEAETHCNQKDGLNL